MKDEGNQSLLRQVSAVNKRTAQEPRGLCSQKEKEQTTALEGRMDRGVLNVSLYIYSYERNTFKQKTTIVNSQVK